MHYLRLPWKNVSLKIIQDWHEKHFLIQIIQDCHAFFCSSLIFYPKNLFFNEFARFFYVQISRSVLTEIPRGLLHSKIIITIIIMMMIMECSCFSCQNHDRRSESRSISKISTASQEDVRNELIQQWLLIVMLHTNAISMWTLISWEFCSMLHMKLIKITLW